MTPQRYAIQYAIQPWKGYLLWWNDEADISQVLVSEGNLVLFATQEAVLNYAQQQGFTVEFEDFTINEFDGSAALEAGIIDKANGQALLVLLNICDDIAATLKMDLLDRDLTEMAILLTEYDVLGLRPEIEALFRKTCTVLQAFLQGLAAKITLRTAHG